MPSKPTHYLKAYDPDTGGQCRIGAGWLEPSGKMLIKLNPGVALTYIDCKRLNLNLWPAGGVGEQIPYEPPTKEDDLPF